jgi:hypothetical protein
MRRLQIALAGTALLAASLAQAQTPATDTPTGTDVVPPIPNLSYTDDYRISVDDDANSDGEIVFRVTTKDGTAKDVTVAIKKGTNENSGASAIKKAFVEQLGTKNYNIEMEDGENVIIERSGGKGDTSLVLVSNSVENVDVKVHWD